MTWRNRNDMPGNLRTALIVGLLVGAIYVWMLWCTAGPETVKVNQSEYTETPRQREWVERRIAYHGLTGVVVLRGSARGWEFYRDDQWCKL